MASRPLIIVGVIIIAIAVVAAGAYALRGPTTNPAPVRLIDGSSSTTPAQSAAATTTQIRVWGVALPDPASTTVDTSSWRMYVDPGQRFSIEYPRDVLVSASNGSASFTFPQNAYFHWPLLDETRVTVSASSTCPALEGAGLDGLPATTTVTVNGVQFQRSISTDVGAGNRYLDIAYDATKGGACYRVLFFDHGTNGAGFYVDSVSLAATYDAKHASDLSSVFSIVDGMLGTFRILAR